MKSKRSVFFLYIKNEHVDFKECTNGKYSYGSGGTQGTWSFIGGAHSTREGGK